MIQMVSYSGSEKEFKGSEIVVNSFKNIQSLDSYDINIINLQDPLIWHYSEWNIGSIDSINDFKSMSVMINNASKSNNIILLPQNYNYVYCKKDRSEPYWQHKELKDMIDVCKTKIFSHLSENLQWLDVIYENTVTKVEESEIVAAFYFNNFEVEVLTTSTRSEKATTIKVDDVIYTTLNMKSYEEIMSFLKGINLIREKQVIPEWLGDVYMFDDNKQHEIIKENNMKIAKANEEICKAMQIIDKNNEYKSILYTSGDDLVKVVFDILENMLGCNLHEFVDKKKEDFSFCIDGITYIGEIKGITSNVKSTNVTQLELHHSSFVDDHPDINDENIRQILLINHQRNLPISNRDPVDNKQIILAKKYGSLIVESITFLRMFEKYCNGNLSREECISLLCNNVGLLEI